MPVLCSWKIASRMALLPRAAEGRNPSCRPCVRPSGARDSNPLIRKWARIVVFCALTALLGPRVHGRECIPPIIQAGLQNHSRGKCFEKCLLDSAPKQPQIASTPVSPIAPNPPPSQPPASSMPGPFSGPPFPSGSGSPGGSTAGPVPGTRRAGSLGSGSYPGHYSGPPQPELASGLLVTDVTVSGSGGDDMLQLYSCETAELKCPGKQWLGEYAVGDFVQQPPVSETGFMLAEYRTAAVSPESSVHFSWDSARVAPYVDASSCEVWQGSPIGNVSFLWGDEGGSYAPLAQRCWLIAPTDAEAVTLHFSTLDTEEHFDVITISACDSLACSSPTNPWPRSDSDPLTLSGRAIPPAVVVRERFVLVHFAADGSIGGSGFSFGFEATPVSSEKRLACPAGALPLNATAGSVRMQPPGGYAANQMCEWQIALHPDARAVEIEFLNRVFDDGADYLELVFPALGNGGSKSVFSRGALLAREDGRPDEETMRVEVPGGAQSMVTLRFSSDVTRTPSDGGFELQYDTNPGPSSSCPAHDYRYTEGGDVEFERVPGPYPPGPERCYIRLGGYSGSGTSIFFTILIRGGSPGDRVVVWACAEAECPEGRIVSSLDAPEPPAPGTQTGFQGIPIISGQGGPYLLVEVISNGPHFLMSLEHLSSDGSLHDGSEVLLDPEFGIPPKTKLEWDVYSPVDPVTDIGVLTFSELPPGYTLSVVIPNYLCDAPIEPGSPRTQSQLAATRWFDAPPAFSGPMPSSGGSGQSFGSGGFYPARSMPGSFSGMPPGGFLMGGDGSGSTWRPPLPDGVIIFHMTENTTSSNSIVQLPLDFNELGTSRLRVVLQSGPFTGGALFLSYNEIPRPGSGNGSSGASGAGGGGSGAGGGGGGLRRLLQSNGSLPVNGTFNNGSFGPGPPNFNGNSSGYPFFSGAGSMSAPMNGSFGGSGSGSLSGSGISPGSAISLSPSGSGMSMSFGSGPGTPILSIPPGARFQVPASCGDQAIISAEKRSLDLATCGAGVGQALSCSWIVQVPVKQPVHYLPLPDVLPSFTALVVVDETDLQGSPNEIILRPIFNHPIRAGSSISFSGFTGSQSPDDYSMPLDLLTDALAPTAYWTQATGTLVVSVVRDVSPRQDDLKFRFTLVNPARNNSGSIVTVSCDDCLLKPPNANPELRMDSYTVYTQVLHTVFEPAACSRENMYGPDCQQTCYGVVKQRECHCPPGFFGEKCDQGGSIVERTSVIVNASGTTQVSTTSGFGIVVPPGALDGGQVVELILKVFDVAPQPSSRQPGLSPNGKAMEMGPRGLRFNTNVTLFLDYNAQTLGEGYTASGFWHNKDTGLWEELGGAVNGALMETQTNHFSEFAVMAIAPPDEECDADECPDELQVLLDCGCECNAIKASFVKTIASEMPQCGSYDDLRCPGQLPQQLIELADSVTAVTAAVVAGSVGGAVAGSVGGAVAGSTAPTPGASVYQLIGAAQFVGVFGNMLDTRSPPEPSDAVLAARRARHMRRAELEGTDSNETKDEGEKSDASGFSEAFGWANMKFKDIFTLKEGTCAHTYLQGFWAVTGTWLSSLASSFGVRSLLDMVTRRMVLVMTDDWPASPLPGFEFGDYELHMVKTAHLGLCQAAGVLFSAARCSHCPCGWANSALMGMAVLWLFAVPMGLIWFVGHRLYAAKERGELHFERPEEAGSWSHYFDHIRCAEGKVSDFAHPATFHAFHSIILAASGTLCILFGIQGAAANGDKGTTAAFFISGTVMNTIAAGLLTKWGRRYIVMVTNIWGKSVAVRYVIEEDGSVSLHRSPVGCAFLAPAMHLGAWLQAKLLAFMCPDAQAKLRCRGEWKKTDKFKIFYDSFNHNGLYFSVFVLSKNLLLGVVLTADPCVLVPPAQKAWVIATVFLAEFGLHTFLSPEMDLINGYKMAVQMGQQAMIMFVAALTVSKQLTLEEGAAVCINMSIIQVALAMPEQIWGIVQNFVIGKYDPKHPNFKMTSIELKIQKELNCGLNGKIHKAKIAVKEFRDLLPVIKRGDIPGTMNGIVANPKLLIALNTVKPNCINVMMRRLFLLPPIQEALETVGAALPVVSTPVAQLKACKWDSAVAFRQGMDAMAAIKDSLEASLQSLLTLKDGDFVKALGNLLGTPDLVRGIDALKPGVLLVPLKTMIEQPLLHTAVSKIKKRLPDHHLAHKLDELLAIKFDRIEDIEDFCNVAMELREIKPKVPALQHAMQSFKKSAHSLGGSHGGGSSGADMELDAEPTFAFPDDLLKGFDEDVATDILVSLDLPEPIGEMLKKGIEAAKLGRLMIMSSDCFASLREGQFGDAVKHFLWKPELLLAINRIKPGLLLEPVRAMVGQQFLVDAVAEVKERVPHDTVLLQKLDAILSAPLEVVEDLQEFCIRAKALIEHKSQALGGLQAITFPDCLLKSLDAFSAIDILKSIRLPPPLGPLLTKGLDGATLAYMVALAAPFLKELKAGNFPEAVNHLLAAPELLQGLDKMKKFVVLRPMRTLMGQDFVTRAVDNLKQHVPDTDLQAKLDALLQIKFHHPSDLARFCRVCKDLADCAEKLKTTTLEAAQVRSALLIDAAQAQGATEGSAGSDAVFEFPQSIFGSVDQSVAIDMLKSIDVPKPFGPVLRNAVDAGQAAHLLRSTSDCFAELKKGNFAGALGTLLGSPDILLAIDSLQPGLMARPLELLIDLPSFADAIAQVKRRFPDARLCELLDQMLGFEFKSPEDLRAYCNLCKEVVNHAKTLPKLPTLPPGIPGLPSGLQGLPAIPVSKDRPLNPFDSDSFKLAQSAELASAVDPAVLANPLSEEHAGIASMPGDDTFGNRSAPAAAIAADLGGEDSATLLGKSGAGLGSDLDGKASLNDVNVELLSSKAAQLSGFTFPDAIFSCLDADAVIGVLRSIKIPPPLDALYATALDEALKSNNLAGAVQSLASRPVGLRTLPANLPSRADPAMNAFADRGVPDDPVMWENAKSVQLVVAVARRSPNVDKPEDAGWADLEFSSSPGREGSEAQDNETREQRRKRIKEWQEERQRKLGLPFASETMEVSDTLATDSVSPLKDSPDAGAMAGVERGGVLGAAARRASAPQIADAALVWDTSIDAAPRRSSAPKLQPKKMENDGSLADVGLLKFEESGFFVREESGEEDEDEAEAEDPAKKLGFANVMGKILTKLDVRAIMGLLEDFASGIPETLQTVVIPAMRLLALKSQIQAQVEQSVDMAKVKAKAKRDSKGSLGNRLGSTGSIGNRLGSAGKVVQVPTGPQAGARAVSQVQTAAAASGWNRVPTAESAASSILSPSGSAVPMLRATPTAGAMPEEIGYDLDPSPKALFGATETVAGARFGCAVTGQRFGHEDVPTRCSSASEGSLPMTPQTPSTPELKPGMSRADWVNRRMSNVPIFQKKSSVVELSPVGFAEDDEQEEEEHPHPHIFHAIHPEDQIAEEQEEEASVQSQDDRTWVQKAIDSVKAWTAEIWIGVFIVICALISFFILAAMANSADCGCSCAAR